MDEDNLRKEDFIDDWEDRTLEESKEKYPEAYTDKTPPIPEITRWSIRRFAYGIGDDNPLWVDPEYGQKTSYGSILAPPSIVIGCGAMGIIRGPHTLPPQLIGKMDEETFKKKIHGWYSGSRMRWYRPIYPNDHLTNLNLFTYYEHKPTKFAGENSFRVTRGVDMFNPRGELVCRMHNWAFVAFREDSQKRSKYKALELKEYWSEEELKELWVQYEKEYQDRRGSKPRYWDEVEIGQEWKLLKGPYTPTSGVAYTLGAVGETFIRAERLMYRTYIKEHPLVGVRNRQNIPEPPVRVHWEGDLASNIGVPAAYDFGGQRIAWISHVMTDWIGDEGFLKTIEGRFVRFNYVGDVQWFTARVVDKYKEGSDHLIKCEIEAVNQRNEITTTGSAIAVLPTKG